MEIKYKKNRFEINVKKVSTFGKFIGLMFKSSQTENLLFEFNRSELPTIHSFFVFFDFLAVWLDEENHVVDFDIVKPFRLSIRPRKPSRKLIEIPVNERNRTTIRFFVGKRKGLNI